MVKAVLGNVERGGHLVEIGAGEPLVADLLARLGYRVTVVDPYDGSGSGPLQFEEFRSQYPDLSFIRDRFPPSQGVPDGVAGVYSISVLEHIPVGSVGGVIDAATAALAPAGCAIHAVDHVAGGLGRGRPPGAAGGDRPAVRAGTGAAPPADPARLQTDPEAYFVSAEAHERWRGALPYEDYPMRAHRLGRPPQPQGLSRV